MGLYGYIRTSTGQQDIETQRSAIARYSKANKLSGAITYFIDDAVKGKVKEKPELQKLVASLMEGDVVIVSELSRLTRSGVGDMVTAVGSLLEKKARLIAIDQNFDFGSELGKMLAAIFGYLAKLEHDAITDRNRRMIAAKRAAGVKLGRKFSMDEDSVKRAAEMFRAGVRTKTIEDSLHISRQTLYSNMARLGYNIKELRKDPANA